MHFERPTIEEAPYTLTICYLANDKCRMTYPSGLSRVVKKPKLVELLRLYSRNRKYQYILATSASNPEWHDFSPIPGSTN